MFCGDYISMKYWVTILCLLWCFELSARQKMLWPDGSEMSAWFKDTTQVDVAALGKRYVVTDFGVKPDSTQVQTRQLQTVIDRCAEEGGGVIVIPRGTFVSGSLFFRQGTHLLVEKGGRLKGSGHVEDYELRETRIEGQTCIYFSALINADGLDGFVIAGPGVIDGNGYHYWKQFWLRKKWNPEATNKDEQRPRLIYIANSHNVTLQDISLQDSPFWTTHVYKTDHVRFVKCHITSPTTGVRAPSSDAIDLDVCHDVLVYRCYMSVNDDAVVLKGGKGTWADKDEHNGPNSNILIDGCHYGTVHGCLTLGSESIYNRNVVLRNCIADNAHRVLWLKMRPDTPQHYEYITVDNVRGKTGSFVVVRPWTQFYKMEERKDMPLSRCNNIRMSNIRMDCKNFFDVEASPKYTLSYFVFEDIDVKDQKNVFDSGIIQNCKVRNVVINDVRK